MLAKSKLNSIESKKSETLINNEISHEGFITIINEEKKYRELKESIRMMNTQRRDVEKIKLIEEDNKIGINEVIKRNEIINNNLRPQIIKMISYCLKYEKVWIQKFQKLIMVKQGNYQIVQYIVLKIYSVIDLFKNNKQKEY